MHNRIPVPILISAILLTSCSYANGNGDNESLAENTVESTDPYYVSIHEDGGHLIGASEMIDVDIDLVENYPEMANVYRITCNYPAFVASEEFSQFGEIDCLNTYDGLYSWDLSYIIQGEGDDWNPDICHLFDTQALGWAYRLSGVDEDDLPFTDYVLSESESIAVVPVDLVCRDLILALGLDESKYVHAISCPHLSPNGVLYPKYNIIQSIDGIDVFENTVFPQSGAQLGLVRVNGWLGFAQTDVLNSNHNTIVASFVNDENVNCAIDIIEYDVQEIVEEGLSIMSLEDVLESGFYARPSDEVGGHLYIYAADLVYMPITIIDEETGINTGETYLYPCWVLLYSKTLSGGDLPQEIDGVIAFNAVNGGNIDVDDRSYWNEWHEGLSE